MAAGAAAAPPHSPPSPTPFRLHLHLRFLYSLLALQLTYILFDHYAYHSPATDSANPDTPCLLRRFSPLQQQSPQLSFPPAEAEAAAAHLCRTWREFYDDVGIPLPAQQHHDPWRQMKWIGKPALCRVKGQLIEKLDEEVNFRRGYALRFTDDVEDKTHLLPWLLASRVDLNLRRRRVLIDLGANRMRSSVSWFLRMYPCDFTEVYAFESNPKAWRAPAAVEWNSSNSNSPPSASNYRSSAAAAEEVEAENEIDGDEDAIRVKKRLGIPAWMMERVRVVFRKAAAADDAASGAVNVTRFMMEELRLQEGDAVVVKMDIEGSEWGILKAWLEEEEEGSGGGGGEEAAEEEAAAMARIVDELFVEVHYAHPSMRRFGWDSFAPNYSRPLAKSLLARLRAKGFFAHAWP